MKINNSSEMFLIKEEIGQGEKGIKISYSVPLQNGPSGARLTVDLCFCLVLLLSSKEQALVQAGEWSKKSQLSFFFHWFSNI